MALDNADRSVLRMSLTIRDDGVLRQQVALSRAQQRRSFGGRRASLPWAQHWQVLDVI